LAEEAGSSVHAYIVATLTREVEDAEADAEFHALGEQRWQQYQRTGEYLEYDDFKAYALGLAHGEKPSAPPVRKAATHRK
jgi:hypothetical protein